MFFKLFEYFPKKMIFVRIDATICQYNICHILLFFFMIPLTNGQTCPPSNAELKPIVSFLSGKLNEVKKYKLGTNPKDAEWAIYRVVKEISTSNRFAPCNNGFPWSYIEQDANDIKDECYKQSDLTVPKNQKDVMDCSKKFYAQFLVRYGKQGIDSCLCFSKHIIPNWKNRYQKYANDYIEEFKTLKHRKLSIAKIRGKPEQDQSAIKIL